MVRMAKGDWVVVCDGRKALFLANTGNAISPALEVREEFKVDNPATAAQGTDAPGRTHQSANDRRSSVGQTDWHDQAEKDFLTDIAGRLEKRVADGEISRIVLVAPPRALGMIRSALPASVRDAIGAEIAKDYVMMPISEIAKLVSD